MASSNIWSVSPGAPPHRQPAAACRDTVLYSTLLPDVHRDFHARPAWVGGMEPHSDAAAGDAAHVADALIPTVGQTVARTLLACAVAVIGIPLMAWLLPQDAAERRALWELLIICAALEIVLLVHHFAEAPRPRLDQEVGGGQWNRVLASAV